jgi:hypothetical protein
VDFERQSLVFCHHIMSFKNSPNDIQANFQSIPSLKSTLSRLTSGAGFIKHSLCKAGSDVPLLQSQTWPWSIHDNRYQ